MSSEKAMEHIKLIVLRTEERGASSAEADSAARLVVKLLNDFPEILRGKPIEKPKESKTGWTSDPYGKVVVKYSSIVSVTKKTTIVDFFGRSVTLPTKLVTVGLEEISMPRWVATSKRLI